MIEGFVNYFYTHPLFVSGLLILALYIEYIIIKLWAQKRIIPIYKRPFPWNWALFQQSLEQDFKNIEIIVEEAFPWWKYVFFTVCILFIPVIAVFSELFPVIICAKILRLI